VERITYDINEHKSLGKKQLLTKRPSRTTLDSRYAPVCDDKIVLWPEEYSVEHNAELDVRTE
jgi:hypothetical protein